MQPFKIFIGYEPNEIVAFHTLVQSILEHAVEPVEIIPLGLQQLRGIHHRKRDPKQSNDFTYIRYLVPYLCGYQGKALFMDCDMLFRVDPTQLRQLTDEKYAVSVVQHNYEPRDDIKYLGTRQYAYPRKNWSSFMVFNCAHPDCRKLTPYLVDTVEARYLHRFEWTDDREIGSLDVRWNWLVGEYDDPPEDVFNVHWTVGGPYFHEYHGCDFTKDWEDMRTRMNHCTQLEVETSKESTG